MAMEELHHNDSMSPGQMPGHKPKNDFETQAEHARDFADKAKSSADKSFAGASGMGESRSMPSTSSYGSTSPGSGGSGAFVSHVPGSSVEAADMPSRSGGTTVQQDASMADKDASPMTKAKEVVDNLRGTNPSELASTAKDKAAEFGATARDKAGEFGSTANERADSAMSAAGQRMEDFATTLRERAPEGRVGEFAVGAADALKRGGDYLESADLNMVRGDMEDLIRRYPVHSLAIGFGLGFLLARAFRR